MGCNIQRLIHPDYFKNILRIKEVLKNLPQNIRVCSKCGKEVDITLSEFIPNPGDAVPFAQAAMIGCDTSINEVIAQLQKKGWIIEMGDA
jgi:hypothetical protein